MGPASRKRRSGLATLTFIGMALIVTNSRAADKSGGDDWVLRGAWTTIQNEGLCVTPPMPSKEAGPVPGTAPWCHAFWSHACQAISQTPPSRAMTLLDAVDRVYMSQWTTYMDQFRKGALGRPKEVLAMNAEVNLLRLRAFCMPLSLQVDPFPEGAKWPTHLIDRPDSDVRYLFRVTDPTGKVRAMMRENDRGRTWNCWTDLPGSKHNHNHSFGTVCAMLQEIAKSLPDAPLSLPGPPRRKAPRNNGGHR